MKDVVDVVRQPEEETVVDQFKSEVTDAVFCYSRELKKTIES